MANPFEGSPRRGRHREGKHGGGGELGREVADGGGAWGEGLCGVEGTGGGLL
jgi:hypothetical protein